MFSALLFRYCVCSRSLIITVRMTVKTCLCSSRAKSVFGFNFHCDKLYIYIYIYIFVVFHLPYSSVIVGSEIFVLISLC